VPYKKKKQKKKQNREMGFENDRKVGTSIGMREYHLICVFMICENK
jgi:hypothetical protein